MKRIVLSLLALILAISGCQAVIDFAPVSPLPTPSAIELPTHLDGYQIAGDTRGVSITCLGRDVAVMEQYPSRILVVCAGATPTPTATLTIVPLLTDTPYPTEFATPTPEVPVATLTPTITPPSILTPTTVPTATVTPTATEELSMTTFTSQPDATAGIDGTHNEASPTSAGPTSVTINTHPGAGNRRFGMLKFDVSSIPAGAIVNSATLYLYNASTATSNRTFAVNSILVANSGWVEGFTWEYANPSTVRWAGDTGADAGTDAGGSVSGVDWDATALGTFTYTANDIADTEHAITLNVAQVQAWVDGANYGFILRRTDASGTLFQWRSSDYVTDITKRPKLVIEYTEAGGDQAARTIEIGGQFGVMTLPTGGAGLVNIN